MYAKLLSEAALFQLKMHHRPFGSQALPGSEGRKDKDKGGWGKLEPDFDSRYGGG